MAASPPLPLPAGHARAARDARDERAARDARAAPARPGALAPLALSGLCAGVRPGDDVASARLRLLALQRADGEDLSRLDDHDLQARLEAWHGRAESLGTDPDPPALMRLASAPAAGEAAAVAAAGPRRSAPVEPAAPAETTFAADVDA
ncbi:MAG: hypothetical protein KGL50_14075, partial [Burkholderiales bacterium]|nr:hypothetical protein [Burkholderiales bacterium]